LGKLPKSYDVARTVGEHYDLLSAFQSYFVFEGNLYSLTTYSSPLEKISETSMNLINCFLILGNENLYYSRKDCHQMNGLIS
jgi:hypothetical protein